MTKHFILLPLIAFLGWITLTVQGQTAVLEMETLNGPTRSSPTNVFAHDATGKVFVHLRNKIYTSSDNGFTWDICNNGPTVVGLSSQSVTAPDGTIYLITNNKLYYYKPDEDAWIFKYWPVTGSGQFIITTDKQNRLWAVDSQNFQGVLYYSVNQGNTWVSVNLGTQTPVSVQFIGAFNNDINYLMTSSGLTKFQVTGQSIEIDINDEYADLVINPNNGDLFHVFHSNVYRLITGNINTWETVYSDITPIDTLLSVNVFENGKMWFHGNNKTIFSQNNGISWSVDPVLSQYHGRYHAVSENIWYQYNSHNPTFSVSVDGNNTWTDINNGIFMPTATHILTDFAGNIYAKSIYPDCYEYSSDNGQTWDFIYIHTANTTPLLIKTLSINNNGVLVAVAENKKVYKSTDNSLTWQQVFDLGQAFPSVERFEFFSGPSHVLYLYAVVNSSGKIWLSNNDGQTWVLLNPPFSNNSTIMNAGSVNSDGNLFFSKGTKLFLYNKNQNSISSIIEGGSFDSYFETKSCKNGKTYLIFQHAPPSTGLYREIYMLTPVNGSYSVSTISTLSSWIWQLRTDGENNVYGTNHHGLFKINANDELQLPIYQIPGGNPLLNGFHVSKNQYVYTNNSGQFIKRSILPLVSTLPDPSSAYQINAWPNPFDQTINFEINGDNLPDNYTIRLFDLLGKCVTQKDFSGPSCYLSDLNMSSGFYFYEMIAEGKVIGAGKIQAN